jgi:DNA-binding transcriptional regulator YdaS (Cro superfamily)
MSGWPQPGGWHEGRDSSWWRPARHGPRHSPATHDVAISRATDREVVVVAAVLVAGSEKAATHRLGLSHSTVKHPPGETA